MGLGNRSRCLIISISRKPKAMNMPGLKPPILFVPADRIWNLSFRNNYLKYYLGQPALNFKARRLVTITGPMCNKNNTSRRKAAECSAKQQYQCSQYNYFDAIIILHLFPGISLPRDSFFAFLSKCFYLYLSKFNRRLNIGARKPHTFWPWLTTGIIIAVKLIF